jgi:asparagine synthase (glutamine-hydrolysing)
MSGICGIVFNERNREVTRADLSLMVKALNFHGDDDGHSLSFGHMAIGAQKFPGRMAGVAELTVHGSTLGLAFHGSLYNLKELFPHSGENFDSVAGLLALYLKEGMGFLERFRGEFVLSIWDGRDETLFLAVDRFRVHALFYYHDDEKMVFSSRMKSLLSCPFPIKRSINPEAIVDIVGSSIIPGPKTIFREVEKLSQGHFLRWQGGETKIEPYWKVSFLNPSKEKESWLAQQLEKHFADSLSARLEIDGNSNNIGAFLSGGVDSSTVTGVLTYLLKHPVKAFSIGFNEERFNELHYARVAAQAFGAEHYEYYVSPKDTCDAIPIFLEAIDEPYANASAIPAYFCAKIAKDNGVGTLYAGDGGDELFAGNQRYADQHLFEYYHKLPAWLREPILKPLVLTMANKLRWAPFVKGKKYIQRASIPYDERISSYDFFKIVPLHEFIAGDVLEAVGKNFDPYEIFSNYYHKAPAQNNLDRHLYIDWILTLADNDLIKVTRMTEAAGVTVRYPFLDHKIAEFSVRVPAHIKMRGRKLRSFQKNAFADLLPLEIRAKKKHGFGLPIPIWLRTDGRLNELMHDLVLSPQSIQKGYFKRKALENLVERYKIDETSFYGTILWNLMILELWHRTCLRSDTENLT